MAFEKLPALIMLFCQPGILNTCLALGNLKYWWARWCLYDQSPVKILTLIWVSLGINTVHSWLHFCCWRKGVLCDLSAEGQNNGSLHMDSSRLLLMVSFPLTDAAMYPYCVTVINLCHKYSRSSNNVILFNLILSQHR